MATNNSTTRQPAAEGPDVVFLPEQGKWGAYLDGRLIATDENNQNAWSAARAAAFAPATQELTITVQPHVCDEAREANFGKVDWTDYTCGADSAGYETIVCIDNLSYDDSSVPMLYAFGMEGVPLHEVDKVLPQIIALMNSPIVQEARRKWEQERDAQFGTATARRYVERDTREAVFNRGYEVGRKYGQKEVLDSFEKLLEEVAGERAAAQAEPE